MIQNIAAAHGVLFPDISFFGQGTQLGSGTMTTATSKLIIYGRVQNTARASNVLRGVGFRLGAVTKGGTTTLTVDVQGVSTSAGNPGQPDGSSLVGGGVTIANANITANAWHDSFVLSGAFGTTPTLTPGQLIAIVIGFGTFNASDSIALSTANDGMMGSNCSTYNGSTYSGVGSNAFNNLNFTDGTFGVIGQGFPCDVQGSQSFSNGSSPLEYANTFKWPYPVRLVGLQAQIQFGAGSTFDVNVYVGAATVSPTLTSTGNPRAAQDTTSFRPHRHYFGSVVDVPANTLTYLAIKATSATALAIVTHDTKLASHLDQVGGADHVQATLSGGAWTLSTLRRLELRALIAGHEGGYPRRRSLRGGLAA